MCICKAKCATCTQLGSKNSPASLFSTPKPEGECICKMTAVPKSTLLTNWGMADSIPKCKDPPAGSHFSKLQLCRIFFSSSPLREIEHEKKGLLTSALGFYFLNSAGWAFFKILTSA